MPALCVDTPVGLVHVEAECAGGKCRRVSFRNVPAFVMHRAKVVAVPGLGDVTLDVAYGGMIYVIVPAEELGFGLAREEARGLVEVGERIKRAAAEQLPAIHPENPDRHDQPHAVRRPAAGADGVMRSKNAVVVSPGRIDRSPCGTGSSARMALPARARRTHGGRGELRPRLAPRYRVHVPHRGAGHRRRRRRGDHPRRRTGPG